MTSFAEFGAFWWMLAVVALIAEVLTGSLFLLFVAVGFFCSAIGAIVGLPMVWQIGISAVAALCALGFCAIWSRHVKRSIAKNMF